MQLPANRPKVFVSSTVSDFHDLRSALKYWLEERGIDVWMSEFPDAVRDPDAGTLEACRAALEESDFYVLLVGGRKGWTIGKGLTATLWEYRLAQEIARRRPLKIVVFVRKEIKDALAGASTVPGISTKQEIARRWPMKIAGDFRKKIKGALLGASPDSGTIAKAGIENTAFTASFINEVENAEMPNPVMEVPANTRYVTYFSEFEDLAKPLIIALRLYQTVRAKALLAQLKWELEENVAALARKRRGTPFGQHWEVRFLQRVLSFPENEWQEPVVIRQQQGRYLWWFWSAAYAGDRLRVEAAREAALSGEFLIFDREKNRLDGGPIHDAVHQLLNSVNDYCHVQSALQQREAARDALGQAVWNGVGPLAIEPIDLAFLYRLADLSEDIISLSLALIDHAAHPERELRIPTLSPPTPFPAEVGRILNEQPSHEDVEDWAAKGGLLFAAIAAQPDVLERAAADMQAVITANREELQKRLEEGGPDAFVSYLSELQLQRRVAEEEKGGEER